MYQLVLHPNCNSLITWGEGLALKMTFESLIQHNIEKIQACISQGKGEGKGAQKPKTQTAGAYPGFLVMKNASKHCYPSPYGMLVHHRVTPQQYLTGTHLYNWVKRDKVELSSMSKGMFT